MTLSTWFSNADSASSAVTANQPGLQAVAPPTGLIQLRLTIWITRQKACKCLCLYSVLVLVCAFAAATPPSLLQPSEPSRLKKKTYAKVTWLFSSGMHFLHSIVLWYPFRNMLSPPLNNVVASWKSFSCFMKLTCCILWKRWHKTPRPIVLVWCMLLFVRMGNLPEMK